MNLAWTNPWDIEIVNSNNLSYVCSLIQTSEDEEEWDQFGESGKYLAHCLMVGDNFTINVEEDNEEDVNFYIFLCTQAMHNVKKDFTDPWKIKFRIGDVVARRYYQKWGTNEASYVFLRRSPIVFFNMFPMLKPLHFLRYLPTIGFLAMTKSLPC